MSLSRWSPAALRLSSAAGLLLTSLCCQRPASPEVEKWAQIWRREVPAMVESLREVREAGSDPSRCAELMGTLEGVKAAIPRAPEPVLERLARPLGLETLRRGIAHCASEETTQAEWLQDEGLAGLRSVDDWLAQRGLEGASIQGLFGPSVEAWCPRVAGELGGALARPCGDTPRGLETLERIVALGPDPGLSLGVRRQILEPLREWHQACVPDGLEEGEELLGRLRARVRLLDTDPQQRYGVDRCFSSSPEASTPGPWLQGPRFSQPVSR